MRTDAPPLAPSPRLAAPIIGAAAVFVSSPDVGSRRRPGWPGLAAAVVGGGFVLLNLVYVAVAPHDLCPDEAHYWDWTRHPDWCYASKGPLVAWLVRGGCAAFGDTPFGVRLPAVVCGGFTLLAVWRLARDRVKDPRFALLVVAAAVSLPAFTAASVLSTIDPPLLACWAWATVFITRKKWAAAGALVAVGTLAKYTMLLFPLGVAAWLLTDRAARSPQAWRFFAVAPLGLVPIVLWNAAHGWVGLSHLFGLADNAGRPSQWWNPLAFVGGQAALLLGVWFAAWVAAVWQARPWRSAVNNPPPATSLRSESTSPSRGEVKNRLTLFTSPREGEVGSAAERAGREGGGRLDFTALLWWTSVPVFAACLLASVKTAGEPNWPAPAYLGGLVLAVEAVWVRLSVQRRSPTSQSPLFLPPSIEGGAFSSPPLSKGGAGGVVGTASTPPGPPLERGGGRGVDEVQRCLATPETPPGPPSIEGGRKTAGGRWLRIAVAASLILGALTSVAVRWPQVVRPLLANLAGEPTDDSPTPVRRLDPTARLAGWRTLAAEVDRIRDQVRTEAGEEPVLAGMNWTYPGELAFYCDGHPTVYSLGGELADRFSQYDVWRPNPTADAQEFRGRTFVYVGTRPPDGVFDASEKAATVTHSENGVPLAVWEIWVGRGYRGFDAAPRPVPRRY